MNRPDFLPIAHLAPGDVAGLPNYLQNLTDCVEDFPAAVAGIITAMSEKFPDAALWTESVFSAAHAWASDLLTKLPENKDWNDVHLARWAATGRIESLAELVRRAIHRDGSNAADAIGTDAIALLAEAVELDPVLKAELEANNVSLGKMKFGPRPVLSFPLADAPKPSQAPLKAREVRHSELGRVPTIVDPKFERAPAFVVDPSAPVADLPSGTVKLGGASLSITKAVGLRDALERAVVALLRPDEGYRWADDANDPLARSILLELDRERGKGLPEVTEGVMQAEVLQIQSRGPDPHAGEYRGRVYMKSGGFAEFLCNTSDMNAAKFTVSERLRKA